MFGKLFGKGGGGGDNKPKPPSGGDPKNTILVLDQQINNLDLKAKNIEKQVNALTEQAKAKIKSGDKNGAKRILAKKKNLAEQMKTIDGQINMLESQKFTLENSQSMRDVMNTLKVGNQAIKQATAGVSAEEFDDIKDEMEEVKASQQEINEMFQSEADAAAEGLDDELADLEKECEEEAAGNLNLAGANKEELPSQPIPAQKNKEEEDLNAFLA